MKRLLFIDLITMKYLYMILSIFLIIGLNVFFNRPFDKGDVFINCMYVSMMLSLFVPITIISNNYSGFGKLCMTFPISRKQNINEKYLISFMSLGINFIFCLLIVLYLNFINKLNIDIKSCIFMTVLSCEIYLILEAIMIILSFFIKSRIAMGVFVGIFSFFSGMFSAITGDIIEENAVTLNFVIVLFIISVIIYSASYFISRIIFERMDF